MTEAIRASDADRDAAAEALADAVATGRLTMAEHNARLDAMFAAVTADQVAAVTADLPARPAQRGALYRAVDAHRCIVVGGRAQRAGRFGIGRFCSAIALFGRLDIDLRHAVPTQDQVTLTVRGLAGTVTVIVPPGWRLREQVLVLGSKRAIESNEDRGQGPLLEVRGVVLGGTFQLSQS
ncbi:MAG TPA: DUF1707 domain-containing protein [Streptosporangiaceae bacterium]|nr:DUF1707 domain-containing protein [Streptosporangiaceae bacterium]